MIIRSLILCLIALVALVLGFLVLRKSNHLLSVRLLFFLVSICLAIWSISLELFLLAVDTAALDATSRHFYAAAAAFCPLVAVFTSHTFLEPPRKLEWLNRFIGFLAILAVLYIYLVPEFIINTHQYGSSIDMANVAINIGNYRLFAGFFCIFFAVAIGLGWYAWRRSKGVRRKQVFVYTVGLLLASLPGFIVDLILPYFGNYSYVWIGPAAVSIFLFATMYSIVKYRMMDIKSAVSRSVSYVLLVVTLALLYVISVYVISVIFFKDAPFLGNFESLLNVALALLLAFIFQPIKRFFDRLTDKIFYYNQCRPEVFSREISAILTQTTDLQLLTRRVNHYIAKTLKAERVTFCIPERGIYGRAGRRRRFVIEEDVRKIMEYYAERHIFPEAIIASEVRDTKMRRLLDMHKTKVVMPLMHQGQEVGILFLGEHKRLKYSMRDIRMLESIASELAVAVQNALSMEEVRELNVSLQRRIDEATKELRFNNLQLQRLDEAKNEFISMASHQLRTPLTSIKGYLDMVLQGDLGRVAPTQKTVLREAFASSERMVRLINDFLNVSRLQTGKFMIEKQHVDMVKIVKEEIALIEVMAEQRSINIKLTVKGKIPEIAVDVEKMRQVILNMIDNAIFYSRPGSKVGINLSTDGKMLEFTVKDSGIGVPKSEQTGVFGKFFRASNARKKRPDGTGVGLFLAKKVVLLHDGEMIFTSEEGKGSTFGFRIPIADSPIVIRD